MTARPFSVLVPPSFHLLPDTLISIELFRGNLLPCGPGVRGVGWPDTPMVRAQALRSVRPSPSLVAITCTAAWVWGYIWSEEGHSEFSTSDGKRFLPLSPPEVTVREYRIRSSHVFDCGGVLVTHPERTLYDLLYLDEQEYLGKGQSAAQWIIGRFGVPHPNVCTRFHGRNRPYRKRAEERYKELTSGIISSESQE